MTDKEKGSNCADYYFLYAPTLNAVRVKLQSLLLCPRRAGEEVRFNGTGSQYRYDDYIMTVGFFGCRSTRDDICTRKLRKYSKLELLLQSCRIVGS
jgi:hypothetical protein